jgi:hypothetical protein
MERNRQMSKLKVEYVPTDRLKTYEKNAKIHTAEQIEQIKKSIQEFGFNDPIAVWKDNEIIEGHGRLIAALELGIEELPIIRLDNLTDEQRKAYTLVHNKLTMNTGFDFSFLAEELSSIVDIDMSEFGFGSFELNTDEDDILPERYDNEYLGQYGEGDTLTTVVTITCLTEQEVDFIKKLLKEEGEIKKLYKASLILERYNENN